MRIVLKFGSGILSTPEGNTLDEPQFRRLAGEVAALCGAGHQVLIVTSAAVAAGLDSLGLRERPEELPMRQACAAVGQGKLMHLYASVFANHGLTVAQLLLTHGDLDSRTRHQNVRNTLERLFDRQCVIPIINENDSVAVEELRFGDNDRLSAEVAILAEARALILLTSVDGLLDASGMLVAKVEDLAAAQGLARDDKGRLSVGGMTSKLQAVRLAVEAGIPTWIASGRVPDRIAAVLRGDLGAGTEFPVPSLAPSTL